MRIFPRTACARAETGSLSMRTSLAHAMLSKLQWRKKITSRPKGRSKPPGEMKRSPSGRTFHWTQTPPSHVLKLCSSRCRWMPVGQKCRAPLLWNLGRMLDESTLPEALRVEEALWADLRSQ